MSAAPVIHSPPADELEAAAAAELALLTEAADYLTRTIRTGLVSPRRREAMAAERRAIESDAFALAILLGEYRAQLDSERGAA